MRRYSLAYNANDAELRQHSFVCDTVRLSLRALGPRVSTLIQFLARSRPVVDGELAVCRRGSVSWVTGST